ncbi:MAG: TetR/AcrR family transcriptional regulator [Acidimicrobiales bacterium]
MGTGGIPESEGDAPEATRGRGRPPSPHTEQAILDATNELLREKPLSELTIEEVARRAKVSKASVYRRWPSKGTLAFDAFVGDFSRRLPNPNTGSLEEDLLALLRGWVRAVRETTTGRTLRGIVAEVQRDPELADAWRERAFNPLRRQSAEIAKRAIERGELDKDADVDVLLDLVYGPAYHRFLQGHRPLDQSFVKRVIASVMAAVRDGAI